MAGNKYIVGLFDHEDKLLEAVRTFKKENVEITDALTPFPVHGLEHELGYHDTRLHTTGFMFGITGTFLALSFMTWVTTSNYPINIGGKPYWALPSFIPITFELTVLFASVGMVIVYCIRNGLYPGAQPKILDERITDDRFALSFEVDENTSQAHKDKIVSLLKSTGAVEVSSKEFNDDTDLFEVETKPLSVGAAKTIAKAKEETSFAAASAFGSKKDDLKVIKGIGPSFENRLNEMGIFTFADLAKVTLEKAAELEERYDDAMTSPEQWADWVAQAKELMKK